LILDGPSFELFSLRDDWITTNSQAENYS
jgi:hypothetical protein